MITRQSWTTLVLGALAGAGLGAGALTLVKRSTGGCCGGSSLRGPTPSAPGSAVPTAVVADGGSTAALTAIAKSGPAEGQWNYRDPKRSSSHAITRDPSDRGVFHLQPVGDSKGPTKSIPMDVMGRVLFANLQRFLENYRPCEAATPESVDGREYLRVRWCSCRGAAGPVRNVWMDAITHELARFEDRTGDGHLIRQLEFAMMSSNDFVPPVPGAAERARANMPAVSSRTYPAFEEFVSKVDLPIYEPAELPAGYKRTDFGFDNRSSDASGAALRVAWIGYDEGVMQMNLFIAPPADMKRIEKMSSSSSGSHKGGGLKGPGVGPANGGASPTASPVSGGCASMPFDTPEELVESEGAVTVRVRSDGCRIVVARDDLPGVTIALVGSAATPRESYIRAIRNLVLVPARAR